jgi:hypothetical protein
MEESLREDLTRAALTHDAQLQALTAKIPSLMSRLEGVNCEVIERFSALQASASESVIRTRADLKAAFTALSSEVKTESASLRRGPS